jgi:outer membrane biosynthesis protein TonB
VTCAATPHFALAQPAAQRTDSSTPSPQTAAIETDEVYKIKAGGDVSAPKLIHSEEPKLSKALRKSKELQNVWVKVKFYVEKDGSTSNISVVGVFDKNGAITDPDNNPTLKELEQGAVRTVELYRFKPANKGGTAVRAELNVVVSFRTS